MSDPNPKSILVFWRRCGECEYVTAAHGRVACPDCGTEMRTVLGLVGAIPNRHLTTREADK